MPESQYNLERNYFASLRLNFQHWYSNYAQGYLIHPLVRLGENAVVADVGTGTGAWLFEVAKTMPSIAHLDGIDIDMSQFPHHAWLPENVQGLGFDIYGPIPDALLLKYDLVHMRYFAVSVRNKDPTSLVEILKRIVKPGGWIQWTESDLWTNTVVKASPDIKSTSTEKLHDVVMKYLEPRIGSSPGWPPQIPKAFEACGLTDVTVHPRTPAPELQPAIHDNFLVGYQELATFATNGDEIRSLVHEAAAEMVASKRGLAITAKVITVIGRVPES